MEFGLIKSFDIDNGELDGLTHQEIFVLGYELAQIDNKLAQNERISQLVHADNQSRIEKACIDANRCFKLSWLQGDKSESWMQLEVSSVSNG